MSNSKNSSVERDGDLVDFALRIWNKIMSEPYYVFHFLVFFSYIPIRCASYVLSPSRASFLLRREIQAAVTFCVLTAIKPSWHMKFGRNMIYARKLVPWMSIEAVREETWEAFIGNTLFFAKIFLAAIALVLDYHLALWYTLVFLVIYFSTQQPPCEILGSLNQLTPLQLETLLTEGNTSRFWLVEFRALSTSSCVSISSFFLDLSITYSNQNLSFGIVDLGLFPNAAEKFGIPLVSLNQLPTYILFENGTEVSRLPEVDFEPKVFSAPLTKKVLCKNFELDRLLLDYVNGK